MLMCFCLDILIAHMPGSAWVGLNDISVENQFVYTDGTPAVSAKARATYMSPKNVFLTYFLILCKSVKTFNTNLKNFFLRLSSILHNILQCQNFTHENTHGFSWSQDFLPWAENQPDNFQNNEDCMHITGTTHNDPGKLNDDFCTATRDYICKKGVINAFLPLPELILYIEFIFRVIPCFVFL